jgi:hypothetical protein
MRALVTISAARATTLNSAVRGQEEGKRVYMAVIVQSKRVAEETRGIIHAARCSSIAQAAAAAKRKMGQ